MHDKKKLIFFLKAFIAIWMRLVRWYKVELVQEKSEEASLTGTIYCTWHENILSPFKQLTYGNISCIVSPSKDGQILSEVLRFLGADIIEGSSSKQGTKATRDAVKALKSGKDIYITPDGPRGPRRELKKGIATIALLSGAPVVVVNYRHGSYIRLKSWDRFIIPLFFTKIKAYKKEPLYIKNIALEKEEREQEFLRIITEQLTENVPPQDYGFKLFTGLKD